jgi:hypothetical protein
VDRASAQKMAGIEAWISKVQIMSFMVLMLVRLFHFEETYKDRRNPERCREEQEKCDLRDYRIWFHYHIGWFQWHGGSEF